MAEGEGGQVNYKDGNWHVVPSGKDQGKEARWNGKKYEIRERGGASASFESEENETPPKDEEEAPTPPPPAAAAAKAEKTPMQQNATRAGLVAGHAGVGREEDALSRYIRSDKEIPPFEGEPAYGGGLVDALGRPISRVMEDYEYQQARSRR
jgi:hypothetical protein